MSPSAAASIQSDLHTNLQGGTDHFSAFNYDGAYNLTSLSSSVFGSTANGAVGYSYDSNNRLTGEAGQGISNSFAYSAASNATTFRGASFGFNQKNQLTATAFAYDGNGNPTTYKGQTLTFDPENRMTSYGSLMTAGYRSDGLRAWKQANGTKTYYYYGGGQLLFEGSNGYITARNVFGPDGLVARTGSGGTWVSYTFDQQGNVTHRTDPSGNVLLNANYESDAYGNPTSWANSTGPYDYNGQWGYYKDTETGLYYCNNRYYDPVNGRWLTQDPIGMAGGINLYSYGSGNPVGGIDSSGENFEIFEAVPRIINGVLRYLQGRSLTEAEAIAERYAEGNIVVRGSKGFRAKVSFTRGIEDAAMKRRKLEGLPTGDTLFHNAHPGRPDAMPHWQTNKVQGHSLGVSQIVV